MRAVYSMKDYPGWQALMPTGHKISKTKWGALITEPFNLEVTRASLALCPRCGDPARPHVSSNWVYVGCPKHVSSEGIPTDITVEPFGECGVSWNIAHLVDSTHPARKGRAA